MRTLVSDILPWIAANVSDSGVCLDTPEGEAQAIAALDLACEALHQRLDQDFSTLWTWSSPIEDSCFALPEDCLEGRQMWINGVTATQHSEWFQGTLANGLADPGSIRYTPEITDLGQFAIPYKLPQLRDTRVGLMAESDADAGTQVTIQVTNEYGQTVQEVLTLPAQQELAVTDAQVRDVVFLQKPRTESNVKLYQVFPDGQKVFVCNYSPQTLLGAWRRKKVPQRYCGCKYVTVKGKRRYYRIERLTDICPFDNRIAIKMAVQSIACLNKNDWQGYTAALLMALNEIQKQMRDADSNSNVAQARFRTGFGANPSQGAGNPIPGTSLWWGRGFGGWGGVR